MNPQLMHAGCPECFDLQSSCNMWASARPQVNSKPSCASINKPCLSGAPRHRTLADTSQHIVESPLAKHLASLHCIRCTNKPTLVMAAVYRAAKTAASFQHSLTFTCLLAAWLSAAVAA